MSWGETLLRREESLGERNECMNVKTWWNMDVFVWFKILFINWLNNKGILMIMNFNHQNITQSFSFVGGFLNSVDFFYTIIFSNSAFSLARISSSNFSKNSFSFGIIYKSISMSSISSSSLSSNSIQSYMPSSKCPYLSNLCLNTFL